LHFGGEYRYEQVYDFYRSNARGTLIFDGSQGPWSANKNIPANYAYLADFLAGLPDPIHSNITWGDPTRTVKINTFALYAQDSWKVRQRLSLDYGIRYDYEGVPYTGNQDLSIFDPSLTTGLAVVGKDVDKLYNNFLGGFSPRVGFAYRIDKAGQTVLRGGYGLYYDSIYLRELLYNTWLTNAKFGPQFNPAGSNEVATASAIGGTITSGQAVFYSYQQALAGLGTVPLSTFDKNFRPAYTQNYNLNVQHSFAPNILAQIGYVGTKGTHLTGIYDINQGALGSANISSTALQQSRPYYSKFNNFSFINELRSNLGSNYNSLQATLNLVHYHGLTSQLGYTWSHALDYETGLLPYLPQDSTNERAEYGNSDYDVRHGLSGFLSYTLPGWDEYKRLTKGWEFSSGFNFHGGVPFTVASSGNPSGNGEGNDRAQLQVANPFAGVSHAIVTPTSGGSKYVQWFSPTAFADAAPNTYATTRRNQFSNPGYYNLDLAVQKTTPITEVVKLQIRAEIFNAFNHNNLSPLGLLSDASETGTISQTIGVAIGNPGIGPGEPLNVQFALKIIF
jgi:hypothetical protein